MTTIAIDFGTTRTKAAWFNDEQDRAELIEIGSAIRTILPSVFYIPPGQEPPLVGDSALDYLDEDPRGIVRGLKRRIHQDHKIRNNKRAFEPVELAGVLFNHIRVFCEESVFHGAVSSCVLTVPVAFDMMQRERIAEAAKRGGFQQIEMIDEPVAAARHWLGSAKADTPRHVVVCDIGGGTTDLALLRSSGRNFESVPEVPVSGFQKGGNDIDEHIFDELLASEDDDSPLRNVEGFRVGVQRAKERFSREQQRPSIPLSFGEQRIVLDRTQVEACSGRFVDNVVAELTRFRQRMNAAGIDEVPLLLIGGGMHILGLRSRLEACWSGPVLVWRDSEYATVLGAVAPVSSQPALRVPTGANRSAAACEYRAVVEMANSDGRIDPSEVRLLRERSEALGLSREEYEAIETDVLGRSLDAAAVAAESLTAKWHALGGESGFLGHFRGNKGACPDGEGAFMHFDGGSIHWHPRTGAFETHGAIRGRWSELGWERSALGYPVSDESELTLASFGKLSSGALDAQHRVQELWLLGNIETDVVGRISYFERGCICWLLSLDQTFVFSAQALSPSVPEEAAADDETETLLVKAAVEMDASRLDAALQLAQAACDLSPDMAAPFYLKGVVLKLREEIDPAIASLTRALRLQNNYSKAYLERALCRLMQNDVAKALVDLDSVLTFSESGEARLWRVHCLRRLGQAERAVPDLENLAQLHESVEVRSAGFAALMHFYASRNPATAAEACGKALDTMECASGFSEPTWKKALDCMTGAYRHAPKDFLQWELWSLCCAYHQDDVRSAAAEFLRLNRHSLRSVCWEKSAEFATVMMSRAAEAGDIKDCLNWLHRLFTAHPQTDAKEITRDPHLRELARGDNKIAEFFQPKFTTDHSCGVMFNYATVANCSLFAVSQVIATIYYRREGKWKEEKVERQKERLGPGETHMWNEVFRDAGWFGGNISNVTVSVKCAEDDLFSS